MTASAPLLVWDFDGTLADTFPAIRTAVATALTAHGLKMCTDDVLRPTIGLGLDDLYTALARIAGVEPAPELVASLAAAHVEAFLTAGAARCAAYPGMVELLADLGDHGVTSAVATSRVRASLELLVDHLGLRAHLRHLQSTGDLPAGRGKPHPDVVLAACEALDRRPGDAVVIGDAPVDIAMGRAAGATTIAVTWGYGGRDALDAAGPDHVVGTPDELRAVLAGLS